MPQNVDLTRPLEHLASQFERALPILFIGAGFSLAATTLDRKSTVPSADELKRKFWALCFPDEEYTPSASLQNLYESALRLHRKDTTELLRGVLTVDSETLPDWYKLYFTMPWLRIYTLNIDDLLRAASRKFALPRDLHLISALREAYESPKNAHGPLLEAVYLNGDIDGIPEEVTFSTTQYAERLARPEPWYVRVAADLVSRPFVFVGTQLDEPPLWQHIELRRNRGGRGMRELRPRSYLVTPHLDAARRTLLAEYNVVWLPFTAEEFAEEVLAKLQAAATTGLRTLQREADVNPLELRDIPLVSSLANNPTQASEFLVGGQPIWADIQTERAILRDCDEALWTGVTTGLTTAGHRGVVIVTGTAGSGKSTALMRVALRLNAEGHTVGWIDTEGSLTPHEIRVAMRRDDAPVALAIDDADMYGSELSSMARELSRRPPYPLIIVGIRAGRVDTVLQEKLLQDVPVREFSMPPLADADIDGLMSILDRENRLGLLKGKSRDEQRAAFRDQAGRHLLVAMIQATSGRRLEEKAVQELTDLGDGARAYGLIAVASAYRFGLQRNEILLGLGESSNTSLNTVDMLLRRHVTRMGHDGAIWARHRVIAEVIAAELQKTGQIKELVHGLAHIAATQVLPTLPRSARQWRMLRHVTNHEFLIRVVGVDAARNLYGELEGLLRWDYHFWLQRGSLEVEMGDLNLAENFLNQARGLAPTDPYVETEYAYLLLRKAIENPTADHASELVREANETLTSLIDRVGERDRYPYHVLGSQGIAWARRGITSTLEKERFLRGIIFHLEAGYRNHPRARELKSVLDDVKRQHLEIAVPAQRTLIDPD
jgi:Mrp family chromosome partitioning ATPase